MGTIIMPWAPALITSLEFIDNLPYLEGDTSLRVRQEANRKFVNVEFVQTVFFKKYFGLRGENILVMTPSQNIEAFEGLLVTSGPCYIFSVLPSISRL